jgi:hypothetical protein
MSDQFSNARLRRLTRDTNQTIDPPQSNADLRRLNATTSDYINNSTVTRSGNIYPKTAGKRRTRRHRRKSMRKRNTKRRRHRY